MTDGDEFSRLQDNATEAGIAWDGTPVVRRISVLVEPGREVSMLAWGDGPPQMVFFHGGGQNAHTFDTVALALRRPLIAVDLPGHGHSGWRADHDYSPRTLADDLEPVVRRLGGGADLVVGMSLGGLAALLLAARHPRLVPRLALIDITPGTGADKAEPVLAFLSHRQHFASYHDIMARTVAFNPGRSRSSLERGVFHNARQCDDGTWTWRWDPDGHWRPSPGRPEQEVEALWAAVELTRMPLLLVRGARSGMVSDADVAELRRLRPDVEVEVVADAGHSVQGDQPVALAAVLDRFADS